MHTCKNPRAHSPTVPKLLFLEWHTHLMSFSTQKTYPQLILAQFIRTLALQLARLNLNHI